MNASIHKYFKIGTLTWMSYPGVEQEKVIQKLASDAYFDAIEVCHCPNAEALEKCAKLLEQSHMTVGYAAQPTLLGRKLNPNAPDEAERLKAQEALIEAVDEAGILGAGGIAFLAGKYDAEKIEEGYAQLVKTTEAVCAYAAKKHMKVELEVFDYNVDKASLIGPAPLAKRFAEDIRKHYDNFGLLVDLSHIPITFETSEFVIQTLGPYITHLHFGNAVVCEGKPGYGDKHPRMGYPNSANDTEELLDYLRVLKAEGFFRSDAPMVLSMEVTPQAGEDADIILANTKRVLNRAWAMLED